MIFIKFNKFKKLKGFFFVYNIGVKFVLIFLLVNVDCYVDCL